MRDLGGRGPVEDGEHGLGFGLLEGADEQGYTPSRIHQGSGYGKDFGEALDGAEGDYVEGLADVFGSRGEYIDVRQCKGADDFAEEGGFFVAGLDQGQGDLRGPEFDRDAGESGAGADVGQGQRVVS